MKMMDTLPFLRSSPRIADFVHGSDELENTYPPPPKNEKDKIWGGVLVEKHGHGSWRALPKHAGLLRCGKRCRLRWKNYLRSDIKCGKFSFEEEQTILHLHAMLGNKWSAIAAHLPGRTDNEIKNYWNTHLKKRLLQMDIDPMTHRPRTDLFPPSFASYFSSMNPWESARLEAEARLAKHYLSLAAYRSSSVPGSENGNINLDLNLLRSACQLEDHATAVAATFWAQQQQQQQLARSMVAYGAQNLDQHLVQVAQASQCSRSYSIPDPDSNMEGCLSLQQEQQGSVPHSLDNMYSLALGCTYPAMDQAAIAPPSDSCLTDESLNPHSTVFATENSPKLENITIQECSSKTPGPLNLTSCFNVQIVDVNAENWLTEMQGLDGMANLSYFSISDLESVEEFPSFKHLHNLTYLSLVNCTVREPPDLTNCFQLITVTVIGC